MAEPDTTSLTRQLPGVAFATICWSDQIFSYTQPLTHLPAAIDSTVTFLQGPTATLKLGGIPRLDLTELLLGNFPGPIGSTYTLIIAPRCCICWRETW